MKVHKVVLTIIDFDEIGADEVKSVIENVKYPNRCISPDVWNIETADIGEWDDSHPLNNTRTSHAEWSRIFPTLRAAQLNMQATGGPQGEEKSSEHRAASA